MRTRTIFFLLAGVGALAAMAVAYRANERRFHALQREMQAVAEKSRQSNASERSHPVYVLAAAPATPAPEAPVPPEKVSDADDPADQPRGQNVTEEEQGAYVGMAFSEEKTDGAWAQQAERSLGGSLRGLTESSTLDALECRATLCKASLKHLDQTKFGDFLDRMLARANDVWNGPIYSFRESVGADGVIRNSIYFAKPGHSIPSPE